MKYLLFILTIVLYSTQKFAQIQNLVHNGTFEQDANGANILDTLYLNPHGDNVGNCPTPYANNSFTYQDQLYYYTEHYAWTLSDKKPYCYKVASPDIKTNDKRTGIFGFRGVGTEILYQVLREPLDPSSYYYIEFYYDSQNSSLPINHFGLKFIDEVPKQCGFKQTTLGNEVDIQIPGSIATQGQFEKITIYYKPTQLADRIAIGSFDYQTGINVRLDDIRVFEVGDDKCADGDWYLQNTDLATDWFYSASNNIVVGSDVMSHYYAYEGNVVAKSGTHTWFKAGDVILMNPGFETEPNAYVETIIDGGCDSFNPCEPEVPLGQNYTVCGNTTTTLEPTGGDYADYSWSPTTYLSDPTVKNPTFTPPPNSSGTISYTLTVDPWCGYYEPTSPPDPTQPPPQPSATAEVNFSVEYHTDPSPNPSVTLSNQTITPGFVEFDIDVDQGAELVVVQIENSNGQYVYTGIYNINDLGCCNMTWNTNEIEPYKWNAITICEEYLITVSSQNNCYPNSVAEKTINWPRNAGGAAAPQILTQTNLITIDGNGYDCLAIETANADNYSIQLQASNQIVIYEDSGPVTGDITCVWDGSEMTEEDQPIQDIIIETLENTDEENSFLSTAIDETFIKEVSIFPNPNTGNFILVTPANATNIEVLDLTGKVVYASPVIDRFTNINLQRFANGSYFVRVFTSQGIEVKKVVVQ